MSAFNLEEKYRPKSIDDFAGLSHVKKVMKALVKHPHETAFIFAGSPGSGKSRMAFVVGQTLKAEIHHIPSRQCNLEVMEELSRTFQHRPMFGDLRVAIFEEADRMSLAAQHVLLSMLDGTATPEGVIFFFTVNPDEKEEIGLEGRFISRCHKLNFDGRADIDSSVEYLTRIWKQESRRLVPDLRQLLFDNNSDIRASLKAIELELIASGTTIGAVHKGGARGKGKPVASISDAPNKGKLIYTLGFENLTPKRVRTIVDGLGVTMIIDCRSVPTSRIPTFSMTSLQAEYGTRYIWKGEILGGRQTGQKQTGVKWLAEFMRDSKQVPLLLCKEESPGACHRHFNIALPLLRRTGINALHICDTEVIQASELQRAIDEDNDYTYEELAV